jgi:hypothetical protein
MVQQLYKKNGSMALVAFRIEPDMIDPYKHPFLNAYIPLTSLIHAEYHA